MKLLDNFKQQIEDIGELKRVWLTTFNLDISFVETWVLPAVLGMDVPVSRMDYEGLQQALNNSGIDFRIYCDPRMIAKEKPKRTSINVYPVSLRKMALPETTNINTASGLFHPKVFYLEGKNKKCVIGAGSANLTLSGWGRNQEVIDFRSITSRTQYKQVKQFFTAIADVPDKTFSERISFSDDDSTWSFIHSLAGPTLLEALQNGDKLETLSVWSPYLADDLAGFIGKLGADLRVELVPDRVDGRYIRTRWSEGLQTLMVNKILTLHCPCVSRDERALMTHAKLWLAKNIGTNRLAVGSWNFTGPGCSSLSEKNWNIEAGIVHTVADNVSICAAPWAEVNETNFATEAQLAEEALKPDELPPIDLSVVFDWTRGEYQVTGEWASGTPETDYQLILPGVKAPCKLCWQRGEERRIEMLRVICQKSNALLDNPFYTLRKTGKTDWQGMINEVGIEFRRSLSFASLDDLLSSYLNNINPLDSDRLILRSAAAQDETQVGGEHVELPQMQEATSYFRLFQATQQRRQHLEAIKTGSSLYHCIFSAPGCLLELAEMASERIRQAPTLVFNWFLAQEVNSLVALAKELANGIDKPIAVADHQWASLTLAVPTLKLDKESLRYLAAIQKDCGYEQ